MQAGRPTRIEEERDVLVARPLLRNRDVREPVQHRCDRVGLREDRGLREPGRATRGAELVDVLLRNGAARIGRLLRREQLFEVELEAVPGPEPDHVTDRADLADEGARGRDERRVHQDRLGLDDAEVLDKLVRCEPDVQRRPDHARLGAREVELDVLTAVRGEHRDPIALPEPELEQRTRQAVRPLLDLPPRGRPLARHDERVVVGEELRVTADDVADQHLRAECLTRPPWLARRHPQRAVEPDHFAVQHLVLDDVQRRARRTPRGSPRRGGMRHRRRRATPARPRRARRASACRRCRARSCTHADRRRARSRASGSVIAATPPFDAA